MVRMILVGDAIVVKCAKWELLKIKKFEIELSHLSAYTICRIPGRQRKNYNSSFEIEMMNYNAGMLIIYEDGIVDIAMKLCICI
jgi:hypothetical protein